MISYVPSSNGNVQLLNLFWEIYYGEFPNFTVSEWRRNKDDINTQYVNVSWLDYQCVGTNLSVIMAK